MTRRLRVVLLAALVLLCSLALLPSNQAQASPPFGGVGGRQYFGSDRLLTGQSLHKGQYLLSDNGKFALILQEEGNLVLYSGTKGGSGVVWSAGTRDVDFLTMQSDGNLVMYGPQGVRWASNTVGFGPSRFVVQTDGNLVVYTNGGRPTWNSHTVQRTDLTYGTYYGSDTLRGGDELLNGEYLRSSDHRHFALMQTDGNLVVYGPGYHAVGATNTVNCGTSTKAVLRSNGTFIVTTFTDVLCFSRGAGVGARLTLQNDGNLVLYRSSGAAVWATNSAGKL